MIRAVLAGLAVGLVIGAAGAWLYARAAGARALADAARASDVTAAQLRADLERQVEALDEQLVAATEARESAEAALVVAESQIAFARRAAQARVAAVRRPVAPAVRARRVAELVDAAPIDVVPLDLAGREGYWLAGHVLVELEASRTASAAWARERRAMDDALGAAIRASAAGMHERAALAAQVERYRLGYEAAELARADLAAHVAAATSPSSSWFDSPILWGVVGVAVGATAVAIVTARLGG